MFIDDQTYERDGRTYRRVLLRNSFRVGGRVRHETVANLSKCEDAEIAALKLALKHKGNLQALTLVSEQVSTKQGLSVGALFLLQQLAKKLGISQALGSCREAKLVLWLVFAAIMEQGSRLSAVRLAQRHAVCDLLNLDAFNEDDLYAAMDWLEQRQAMVEQKNRYLEDHPRAQPSVAKRDGQAFIEKLKFDRFAQVRYRARTVLVQFDEDEITEAGKLDGCYVIKTDLVEVPEVSAQEVHDRYMELTEVEWAFRTMKTVMLEMRGIFVRKEGRTRAHVFIIMLAYLLAFELRRLWQDQEATVEEGLSDLSELCATEVIVGSTSAQTIPEPRDSGKALLKAAGVSLPDAIPCRNVKVVTRKKLVPERRSL